VVINRMATVDGDLHCAADAANLPFGDAASGMLCRIDRSGSSIRDGLRRT